MEVEQELKSFIKVWTIAISLLCYCYYIASRIPKGFLRLIAIFPVLYTFLLLPLSLSSIHLCGITAFLLAWLANFKLLLFAFDHHPLSPPLPSLPHFLAILSLPLLIKKPSIKALPEEPSHPLAWPAKAISLSLIVFILTNKQNLNLHPNVVFLLCFVQMYLAIEMLLAVFSFPAGFFLGLDLERQFHEPFLSTSLQNFWSRRWNRMAPSILQPTVYNPIRNFSSRFLGRLWGNLPAALAAFAVSGLIHELLFYYFTRAPPTWEVTAFFVLHGVCVAVEVGVKAAAAGKVALPAVVSWGMTMAFMVATGKWLFYPQLQRNGTVEKTIGEYWAVVEFVKRNVGLVLHK